MQSQVKRFALWETTLCAVCSVVQNTFCRNSMRSMLYSIQATLLNYHTTDTSVLTTHSDIPHDFCALCTYFKTFKWSLQSTAYYIFKVKYSKWYFQQVYIDTYHICSFWKNVKSNIICFDWPTVFGSAAVRLSSSFINQTSFSSCCSQHPSPRFKAGRSETEASSALTYWLVFLNLNLSFYFTLHCSKHRKGQKQHSGDTVRSELKWIHVLRRCFGQ